MPGLQQKSGADIVDMPDVRRDDERYGSRGASNENHYIGSPYKAYARLAIGSATETCRNGDTSAAASCGQKGRNIGLANAEDEPDAG